MEAVCHGKEWDVLLVDDSQGRVAAAMPYLLGRKLGVSYIVQPQLTQFCGPWFNLPDDMPPSQRTGFENRYGAELVARLEALRVGFFHQHFAPECGNWLPFLWQGYRQSTRYTYRLPSLADPAALRRQASRVRLRHLADIAAAGCTVDFDLPTADFVGFHRDYYARQHGGDLVPSDLMQRLVDTARSRRQALLGALRGPSGELHAAWFTPFDSRLGYSILLALGPQAAPNAMTYLIWHQLDALAPLTRGFDFEGSIEPGLEFFYRSFGAVQCPFLVVSKGRNRLFDMLFRLKTGAL